MERIKAQPTDGLSYNATEPTYWDSEGLDKEIERVFDVCNGCRLCFNLCPSFPALFDAAEKNNGEVRNMDAAQKQEVIDLCYNCKVCELKCPYTTRDQHPFQLDFLLKMDMQVGQQVAEQRIVGKAVGQRPRDPRWRHRAGFGQAFAHVVREPLPSLGCQVQQYLFE